MCIIREYEYKTSFFHWEKHRNKSFPLYVKGCLCIIYSYSVPNLIPIHENKKKAKRLNVLLLRISISHIKILFNKKCARSWNMKFFLTIEPRWVPSVAELRRRRPNSSPLKNNAIRPMPNQCSFWPRRVWTYRGISRSRPLDKIETC